MTDGLDGGRNRRATKFPARVSSRLERPAELPAESRAAGVARLKTLQAGVGGDGSPLVLGSGLAAYEEGLVDHALPLLGREVVEDLDDVNEREHHARVELLAHVLPELVDRLPAQRLAVGPVRGHGVPGVAGMDDAAGQRYLLPGELVRVALAVPALVRSPDDGD